MATQYSNIYIDGITTEEIYADGGQIVEAWLDGECIWKLVENYLQTAIHYITWYNGMYYAVGQVRTLKNGYGQWFPSIFIGETVDNLKAYRQSLAYGNFVPMTDYSRGWGINKISCDKNGIWIGRISYTYVPSLNSTQIEIMSLHSGFKFTDQEEESFFPWFADNNTLNIPKSEGGTLNIGTDEYIARIFSTNPVAYSSIYHRRTGGTAEIETLEGYYSYIFNIGEKAYIPLQNRGSNLSEYIWTDAQNTPNPNYRFPLIHIRSLPEWNDAGNIYLSLGEMYQMLKNEGNNYIAFRGINMMSIASNDECMISYAYVTTNIRDFYMFLSFDGSILKQKFFTKYPLESSIRNLGSIGEKFYYLREVYVDQAWRYVMAVFDSIDNMFNAKEFIIDDGYAYFEDAFIKSNFLYLMKSNTYIGTITWLKVNLVTVELSEETVEIASK